jgi:hypothetical protein
MPSRCTHKDTALMRRANFNPFTRQSPLPPLTFEPPSPDPSELMSEGELVACAQMVAAGLAVDTETARVMRRLLDEGKAKPAGQVRLGRV